LRVWNTWNNFDRFDLRQFETESDSLRNIRSELRVLRHLDITVGDGMDDRFQVRDKNGDWKAFRLLDQLPAVRSKPKAFALADRILQIGEEMTKIITKNAGLASEDLIDLLGRYMAHYAIISTIHKLGETQPYEPGWHKMGYFPRELDEKVATGYRELSQFLGEYSKASKRMLEALPVDGSQRS
jgi:hypothetical protein